MYYIDNYRTEIDSDELSELRHKADEYDDFMELTNGQLEYIVDDYVKKQQKGKKIMYDFVEPLDSYTSEYEADWSEIEDEWEMDDAAADMCL